jgi:hypothetical protein
MHKLMLTLASLAALTIMTAPAAAFKCDSGRPGTGQCSCRGRADCKDMRHSEMCGGSLSCSKGKCTCAAALVEDPDAGGEVNGHVKGVLGTKPVLNAQ